MKKHQFDRFQAPTPAEEEPLARCCACENEITGRIYRIEGELFCDECALIELYACADNSLSSYEISAEDI